jgi:hypothetical protein
MSHCAANRHFWHINTPNIIAPTLTASNFRSITAFNETERNTTARF